MRSVIIGFAIGAGLPCAWGAYCIVSSAFTPQAPTSCGLTGVYRMVMTSFGSIALMVAPFSGMVGVLIGNWVSSFAGSRGSSRQRTVSE